MSESDQVRLSADLNRDVSVQNINKSIKAVESNPLLKQFRVKIDVNQDELNQLMNFMNPTANQAVIKDAPATETKKKTLSSINKGIQHIPAWFETARFLLDPLVAGMKAAIQTIVQVDNQIIELKRSMNEETNFDNLLLKSTELAKELGRSLTDVNQVMIELAQQGFNEDQMLSLANSVTVAQNVSKLDSKEAIDTIAIAMSAFNIEADKSIGIVDKLVAINSSFSVASNELAQALQLTSSTGDAFGVTLENLLGDATAIMQVTKESGNVTGDALNTIYSRLTTVEPAVDTLKQLGINITQANGLFKSSTQILDEVARKFGTLNDEAKLNASITLAGQDYHRQFLALMDNRNVAHEAAAKAMYSEGSAMNEQASYMQSYEGRIVQMKAAWQEFSLAMGNAILSDSLIMITSALTEMANIFSSVVRHIGFLPPVLGTVATALAVLSPNFRTATIAVITFGNGIKALGVSAKSATVALRSLGAATVVGAVFVAIGFALEGLMKLFSKSKESQEDYFDSLKQNMNETSQKIASLKELQRQLHDSNSSQEELQNTYKQLGSIMPEVISHYDKHGNIVYKSKEAIDELIKSQRELYALQQKNAAFKMKDSVPGITEEMEKSNKNKNKLSKQANEQLAREESYTFLKKFGDETNVFDFTSNYQEDLKTLKEELKNIYSKHGLEGSILSGTLSENFDLRNLYGAIDEDTFKSIQSRLSKINGEIAVETENIKKSTHEYNYILKTIGQAETIDGDQNLSLFFNQLADAFTKHESFATKTEEELNAFANSYQSTISNVAAYIKDNKIDISQMLQTGNMDELVNAFPQLSEHFGLLSTSIQQSANTSKTLFPVYDELKRHIGNVSSKSDAAAKGIRILDAQMDSATGAVKYVGKVVDSKEAMEDHNRKLQETVNSISKLESAYNTLQSGQELSLSSTLSLLEEFPELLSYVDQHTGALKLEGNVIEEIANQRRKARLEEIKDRLEDLKSTHSELETKRDMYLQFYQAMAGHMPENVLQSTKDKMFTAEEKAKFDDYQKKVDLLNGQIAALSKPIVFKSPSGKGGSSSTSSVSDDPKSKDITDAKINSINNLALTQQKVNDLLEQSISKEEAYSNQIQKTSKLISGKTEEMKLLQDANKELLNEQKLLEKENTYNKPISTWYDQNGNASEEFIKLYNKLTSGKAQESLQELFDKYKKFDDAIKSNKSSIGDLTKENANLLASLDELKLAYTQNYLNTRNAEVDTYNQKLKKSRQVQSTYEENSPLWIKEQEKQIKLLNEKKQALHEENNWIRARQEANNSAKNSEKLTTEQIELLNKQLEANSDAWYETVTAITSATKSLDNYREKSADKVIADYKKMLEQQRDLELSVIDSRMNDEDQRHKRVMDNYKNERDSLKETIDAQLKAFNRTNATEDYDREINKLLEEESQIQKKINEISHNNSYEDKAKRNDLEEQLANVQEQIEGKQRERGRTLQKEALDDLLEDREQHISNLEQTEDTLYQKTKDKLNDEKELRQIHWKSVLGNESEFYNLKQQLMSNDVLQVESALTTIRGKYDEFFSYLRSNSGFLGEMFGTINSNTQTDYKDLDKMPLPSANQKSEKEKAWEEYLNNKKKAEAIKNSSDPEFQRLKAINTALREKWGFEDGSYEKLKNVKTYHQGGEVGVEGTTTQKWWEDTLQSNEEFAVLKKGEVVLHNPLSFIKDLPIRLMNTVTGLASKTQTIAASSGTVIENISVVLQGTVQDGSNFSDLFVDGLNRKGIRIGR
ncbi:phage tail tape measure protein [Paenibacillus sp. 1011MAR3C5]|uniref:phage tail tape measure protein n=1 Tax=Paenibacillus sp. 1011MAR3C5 TaxID=1675787 RepID=UPI000E6C4404|nr:phage tail tape measure protein [Paenibacillus sp. 1011MAR3C5]RJE90647.1 phage tail tape measure protein [Paenibacillus sp. 1011MAR3C5]